MLDLPFWRHARRVPRSPAFLSRLAGIRAGAAFLALAVAALTLVPAPSASASGASKPLVPQTKATGPTSPGRHPTSPVCRAPRRAGEMACLAMTRDDVAGPKGLQRQDAPAGFGPADLVDAYDLPSAGSGQTVAYYRYRWDQRPACDGR